MTEPTHAAEQAAIEKPEPEREPIPTWEDHRNYAQAQLSKVRCGICGRWGTPDWLDFSHKCGMRLKDWGP